MELDPTAYVILGMLSWRPMSRLRDQVARRQLHALLLGGELRADLPRAAPPRRGRADRGRASAAGRPQAQRLRAHVRRAQRSCAPGSTPSPRSSSCATRGSLKLFFADRPRRVERAATLRGDAPPRIEGSIERLREIEAAGPPEGFALLVLRYGIEINEWMADWCERPGGRCEQEAASERRSRLMFDAPGQIRPPPPALRGDRRRSSSSSLAGAIGGSVADRLDPYGADDPATESVKARRTAPGARLPGAGGDRAGRGRSIANPAELAPESKGSSVGFAPARTSPRSPASTTRALAPSSPTTATHTYLAVALRPTDDKARQDAAEHRRPRWRASRASSVGGWRSPRSR